MLLAGDDDVLVGKNRRGKNQPGIARGRLVEKTHDLAAFALGRRQALVPILDGQEFNLQPHPPGDQLHQICRNALVLPLRVDPLEGCPVGVHAHLDGACLGNVGLFRRGEINRGGGGHRNGGAGGVGPSDQTDGTQQSGGYRFQRNNERIAGAHAEGRFGSDCWDWLCLMVSEPAVPQAPRPRIHRHEGVGAVAQVPPSSVAIHCSGASLARWRVGLKQK